MVGVSIWRNNRDPSRMNNTTIKTIGVKGWVIMRVVVSTTEASKIPAVRTAKYRTKNINKMKKIAENEFG
jgi:hypothetical protein